jgi:hypothetical protein
MKKNVPFLFIAVITLILSGNTAYAESADSFLLDANVKMSAGNYTGATLDLTRCIELNPE